MMTKATLKARSLNHYHMLKGSSTSRSHHTVSSLALMNRRIFRTVLSTFILLCFHHCFADFLPEPDVLESEGAIIGTIIIVRVDVFDPKQKGEDEKLFQLINFLHIETRESVIRRELLFKEGDRYNRSLVEESARNLRKLRFLYTALIEPFEYRDGVVDLRVYTQDAWTTKIGFNIGRKGGVNTYKVGFEDENFLGFGKKLSVERFKRVENSGTLFRYFDYQLLGTKWNLTSSYEKNTDGTIKGFFVGHPFFSLETRWSCIFNLVQEDQIQRIYHDRKVSNIFRQKKDFFEISYGVSRGLRDGIAKQYDFFYSYEENKFSETDDTESLQSSPPAGRKYSTVGIAFRRIENSFLKASRFKNFGKIEDFGLGNAFSARIGISPIAIGSEKNGLIVGVSDAQGFSISKSSTLLLSARYDARIEKSLLVNALFSFSGEYFNTRYERQTIFLRLAGDIGKNLYPENQFLLGGDTGLRGYPARFLDGSRQLLFTAEDRIFTDLELFHLFKIGFSAFFDAGLAWNYENEFSASAFKKDIGFGLRVGNRRSSLASIVHIDVVYSLDRIDGKRKLDFLVMTAETF